MSLANNHLNDYGEKPVSFTRDVLRKAGIKSFGFNFGSYDSPQVCHFFFLQHHTKARVFNYACNVMIIIYNM